MDWYAPILRSIVQPAARWKNGRRHFNFYLREFQRTQYLSPEELRELQVRRLRALLDHAYHHSPYYRRQFGRAGVTPADIRDLDDLTALPLLSKEQLRAEAADLMADNFRAEDLRRQQTGGSTGSPMRIYYDRRRADARLALAYRHDQWTGWRLGERQSYVWCGVRDLGPVQRVRWRLSTRIVRRNTWLDAAALDEESMARFAADLKRWRPALIIAYAGAAYVFARFLIENQIEVPVPKGVITSAELLQPHQRPVIEQGLGAPVFDRYGTRETGVIASECERHQGLHIAVDSVLVEVLTDDGAPAAPGEPGEVVVTDLLNYGLPLIRYRIGDTGVLSSERCDCGRGLPLMEMVGGRVSDFLVTPRGTMVTGVYLSRIIAQRPGLGQVLFVQDSRDHVQIKVIPGRDFTPADVDHLEMRLAEQLGPGVSYEREIVREIERGPGNKHRFCICNVPTELFRPQCHRSEGV